MAHLSKEERKRLRREAEASVRQEEARVTVVSPEATLKDASPDQIVLEAAKVGVRLSHREIDELTHALGVPDQLEAFSIVIGYGQLDEEILRLAQDSEWLIKDPQRLAIGTPAITLRGKVLTDPVIDFLAMTVLRVIGRLTHGTMITGPQGIVNDDWLSWSLDYADCDMFKVTRVYDDPPPDYTPLVNRFPQLRAPLAPESGDPFLPIKRGWMKIGDYFRRKRS